MITKLAYVGTTILLIPVVSITFVIFILGMFAEGIDRLKVFVTNSKGGL